MKRILSLIALSLISFVGFSQTKGISYQAVIIDPNPIEIPGKDVTAQPYVSKDVWIRFGIYSGTTLQYEELHKTKTDEYGLVNLIIGAGVNTGKAGTFTSLSWDGVTKNIITNVSFDQGGRYTEVSNQKLTYVPYSLLSETAVKLAGVLPVNQGGTGATNAIAARTNLGLGNVDNTADVDKPVSIATLAILDTKEAISNKSTNIIADSASSVKYPSVKAIKDYIDSRNSASANSARLAAKATALETPRTINGVPFDGTANITIPVGVTPPDADATTKGLVQLAGDLSGTAASPTIAAGSVNTAKIADGAVTTGKLASGAVTTAKVADGAITDAKITSVVGSKVTGNIAGNAGTATKLAAPKNINGVPFDGSSDITISASASTLSGTIAIANGGTGASTAAGARTNLGLVIGTDVLAQRTFGTAANSAATDFVAATEKGANNGVATLGVNGKIPSTQIPAISFQNVNVVNSDASMTAIVGAQVGSIAIRTDNNNNYVLSALPASTLSNWIALATPLYVSTVNGYAGPNVSLTTNDVPEGSTNKYYTDARVRNAISATGPLNFNTSTGVLSMTTASTTSGGFLTASDFTNFNNKQTALTAGVDYATPSGNITGNAANVTGIVSIANGGTGTSTASGALLTLGAEPSANKSNDILVDGNSTTKFPTFKAIKDYVDQQSANAGVADNSITSAKINGSLAVLKGGTGATTAAGARTNLGLVIGTDVMAANFTTTLTGDVTGSGNGTFATTVNAVGGVSSATISTLPTSVSANTASITANTSAIAANTTNITANTAAILLKAPIASPAFTGTPTAPTPTTSDNSTKVATTEYVKSNLATVSAGTLTGTTLASTITGSSLTSVGTITSGVWSGTEIAIAKGGTGATTAAAARTNLGLGSLATKSTIANADVASGAAIDFTKLNITKADITGLGIQEGLTAGSGISIASGTISATDLTTANLSSTAGITNAQLANSSTTLGSTTMTLGGTVTSVTGLTSLAATNLTGTLSGTATSLATGRTIALTGDVTYTSPAFDGSGNVTAAATLANSGVASGTYGSSTAIPVLTVDTKGRVTSASTVGIIAGVNSLNYTSTTSYAAGGTISGTSLTLAAASGTNPGLISTGAQTIAGAKTFSNDLTAPNFIGNVTGTVTGNLSGTANTATNLAGGVSGSIPFQTAAGVTGMIPTGQANQILTSTGSGTYTWTSVTNVTGNSVPYTGATGAVNLGAYDLTVNGLTVGKGGGSVASNTALGINALAATVSTTFNNTAIGNNTLANSTTANHNTAIGYNVLKVNTTSSYNTAIGSSSLAAYTALDALGGRNVTLGAFTGQNMTAGWRNVILGYNAGVTYGPSATNLTSMDESILIGYNTKPLANATANEIVIGTQAIGNGYNTVTIGNSSITANYFKGSINLTGNVNGGTWSGTTIGSNYGGAGSVNGILKANGSGVVSAAISGTDYQAPLTAGSGISIASGTISATGLTTSNLSSSAGITNTQLANSSTTIGSTTMTLGGTVTSVTGLTSLAATNLTGTLSGTATSLATGRTIALTGDVTYTSPAFDGSGNVTAAATLAASGVASGTYGSSTAIPVLTLDTKGRVTSASTVGIIAGVNSLNYTSTTSYAAGGTISGTSLTLAAADGTNPGLISTGAQTIAGAKTFNADVTAPNFLGNATTATTAGNITATSNTTLTSLANLATVGTITSGIWSATEVAIAKGGTGATTAADARTNLGLGTLATKSTIANADIASGAAIDFSKLNITKANITGLGIQDGLTAGSGISISSGVISATGLTTANLSSTAGITNAQLANSSTTLGSTTMTLGGTVTSVTGLTSLAATNLTGALTGNASTATTLATARNINGVAFDGSANITIAADANTLSGTTLASNVVSSSLTGVGTITSGTWSGTTISIAKGGTGATTKSAAFDALSPMTASGDLIYGGTSGTGTRLGVGTTGQVLTVSGGAPSWATPTGVTSIGAISGTATSTGATITSGVLNLTPADANNGGIVNTSAQTFAGTKTFSNDITVNSVKLGKGGGTGSGNIALGSSTLNANSSGSYNTAVGANSMVNTTASSNTAVGYNTLNSNTTGTFNVAIGVSALGSSNSYNYNVGIGQQALVSVKGNYNVAIGDGAGASLGGSATTGNDRNILIGASSGYQAGTNGYNYAGKNSVLIGYDVRPAADNETNEIVISGYNGTAGTVGLGNNTTLIGNNATQKSQIYGALTVVPNAAPTTTDGNSILLQAQNAGTGGNNNGGNITLTPGTATGTGTAGQVIVTGGDMLVNTLTIGLGKGARPTNTALGYTALASNTTSSENVAVGYSSLYTNTTGSYNTAVGYKSMMFNTTGYSNTAHGDMAMYSNTTGNDNTGIGLNALYKNTSGTNNTGVGSNSMYSNTTGKYNTSLGFNALYTNATSDQNTAVGYEALKNTTSANNTAVGYSVLSGNSTGTANTGMGNLALGSNTTGSNNAAFGAVALRYVTTGSDNVAFGQSAGANSTGSQNVFIGSNSGLSSTSVSNNIFLGFKAGQYYGTLSNTSNTTGDGNIMIGTDVRPLADGQTNQIVIAGYTGSGAGMTGNGSNTVTIGNTSNTANYLRGILNVTAGTAASATNGLSSVITAQNAGAGNQNGGNITLTPGTATGTGTAGIVQINGQVQITGGSPGAGEVLTSNASGLATWSYSIGSAVVTSTTTYAITLAESVVFYTGTAAGAFTIPAAASTNAGKEITIKNKTAFGITVTPASGSIYIDNANASAANVSIGIEASNNWIKLVSDGTQWNVIRALF